MADHSRLGELELLLPPAPAVATRLPPRAGVAAARADCRGGPRRAPRRGPARLGDDHGADPPTCCTRVRAGVLTTRLNARRPAGAHPNPGPARRRTAAWLDEHGAGGPAELYAACGRCPTGRSTGGPGRDVRGSPVSHGATPWAGPSGRRCAPGGGPVIRDSGRSPPRTSWPRPATRCRPCWSSARPSGPPLDEDGARDPAATVRVSNLGLHRAAPGRAGQGEGPLPLEAPLGGALTLAEQTCEVDRGRDRPACRGTTWSPSSAAD